MSSFEAIIQEIKDEADGVKTFVFDKPADFNFYPGQYCWLSLPGFEASPMAIASGNSDDLLEFSIRAWGELTNELFDKSTGAKVNIEGPHGTYFPVQQIDNSQSLYLVGGGTGITPIRSLTKSLQKKGKKKVFYGAKTPDELLYQYEFDSWPATIKLTVDKGNESWEGNTGLVTSLLETEEFEENAFFFVCGPSAMEKAVIDYLTNDRTISSDKIFVSLEKFDDEGNVIGPVLPVTDNQVEF